MYEVVRVIVVIVIVGVVIGRQLVGENLRGKRLVILPIVLAIIGLADLTDGGRHLRAVDVACLLAGSVVVAGIGALQGAALRVEKRNGVLWVQMPLAGIGLWVLLIASRVTLTAAAIALGAHVAAAASTILLMLGINRIAQAAVVLPRALAAGIPFAPERDGSYFFSGLMGQPSQGGAEQSRGARSTEAPTHEGRIQTGSDWSAVAQQAAGFVQDRRTSVGSRRSERRRSRRDRRNW